MLSDYLADALATTRQDLREAQLGLGQFNLAVAAAERRTRRQLRKTAGTDPVPPPSAAWELELLRRDSAITNFFRAAGSVMDNLATAVAIIGGIDIEVVERFTWPGLESAIRKAGDVGSLSGGQSRLLDAIDDALGSSGPPGWLAWTLSMRNMLVHRPRRLWLTHLRTQGDARAHIIGAQLDLLLPLNPAATDVEVMRAGGNLSAAFILEPAQEVMAGVFASIERVVGTLSEALAALYGQRAADPELISQPLTQWRPGLMPAERLPLFAGYNPSGTEPELTSLLTGEDMRARMAAAAVYDNRSEKWPEWLGATATLREEIKRQRQERRRRR